jgi:hypothetical protein
MCPSTQKLCTYCSRINFDFFTKGRDNQQTQVISWSTLDLERCQICQLIYHCVSHGQGLHQHFKGGLRGVYTGEELQLYLNEEGNDRRLDYSIRQCQKRPDTHSDQEYQVSTHLDIDELKSWLRHCKNHRCLP